MAGFRAAGWTCLATGGIAILIGSVGLRSIGIAGQKQHVSARATDTDLLDSDEFGTPRGTKEGVN